MGKKNGVTLELIGKRGEGSLIENQLSPFPSFVGCFLFITLLVVFLNGNDSQLLMTKTMGDNSCSRNAIRKSFILKGEPRFRPLGFG